MNEMSKLASSWTPSDHKQSNFLFNEKKSTSPTAKKKQVIKK